MDPRKLHTPEVGDVYTMGGERYVIIGPAKLEGRWRWRYEDATDEGTDIGIVTGGMDWTGENITHVSNPVLDGPKYRVGDVCQTIVGQRNFMVIGYDPNDQRYSWVWEREKKRGRPKKNEMHVHRSELVATTYKVLYNVCDLPQKKIRRKKGAQ